jgi:hypothetical protein
MVWLSNPQAEAENRFGIVPLLPQLCRGEEALARNRKAFRQNVFVLSLINSKLSAFQSSSWNSSTSIIRGAATKEQLKLFFAEDYLGCGQRVLTIQLPCLN